VRDVNGVRSNAALIGNGSSGTLTIDKKIGDKGITQSGKATISVAGVTNGTAAVAFPQSYDAAPIFAPSAKDAVGI
jgi:hypothetical protein